MSSSREYCWGGRRHKWGFHLDSKSSSIIVCRNLGCGEYKFMVWWAEDQQEKYDSLLSAAGRGGR